MSHRQFEDAVASFMKEPEHELDEGAAFAVYRCKCELAKMVGYIYIYIYIYTYTYIYILIYIYINK